MRTKCHLRDMNLINRNTDYAVRALLYMAQRPDQVLSVTDLHTKLNVPRPYLRTILQKMAHAGILSSHRGQHGGFELNKLPETILLTDVIELFQGEVDLSECVFQGEACSNRATCSLRATIKEVEEMVVNKLSSTTIATLGTLP